MHIDLSIHEEENCNNINTEKNVATIEEEGNFNNNNGIPIAIVDEINKEGIFLKN